MTDTFNPMQQAVHEFLVKHLGAAENGWPNKTGIYNKWLLIKEEFNELTEALGIDQSRGQQAITVPDEAQLVKEICDLLYVTYNLAEELELNLQPLFDQVHASNMTKTPAALSPTNKILKGPDYQPPQLQAEIERQRSLGLRPNPAVTTPTCPVCGNKYERKLYSDRRECATVTCSEFGKSHDEMVTSRAKPADESGAKRGKPYVGNAIHLLETSIHSTSSDAWIAEVQAAADILRKHGMETR